MAPLFTKSFLVVASVIAIILIAWLDVDAFKVKGRDQTIPASGGWRCVCIDPAHIDCQCIELNPKSRNAAIRAPLFAMISAFVLLVGLIPMRLPRNLCRHARLFTQVIILVSATAGVLAGWNWLSGETNGEPWRYIFAIVALAGILAAATLAGPLLGILRNGLRWAVGRTRRIGRSFWGQIVNAYNAILSFTTARLSAINSRLLACWHFLRAKFGC